MKTNHKLFLGSLIATALLGMTGCVGGYVEADSGVYYGGPGYRDPWFHDGTWVDGHSWYRDRGPSTNVGIYLHPPRPRHR